MVTLSTEYFTPKGRSVTVTQEKRRNIHAVLVYYQGTMVADFPGGANNVHPALIAADDRIENWYAKPALSFVTQC